MSTEPTGKNPELTPEWWTAELLDPRLLQTLRILHGDDCLKAIAALCLHGQPFGFAWKDVWELRSIAATIRAGWDADKDFSMIDAESLERVAARVEALLPPPSQETSG